MILIKFRKKFSTVKIIEINLLYPYKLLKKLRYLNLKIFLKMNNIIFL
jgi:hypothetical protein